MYKHILAPVDGSPASEGALQTAQDLANTLGAKLTVFYALPTADAYALANVPPFVDRAEIETKTLLDIHKLFTEKSCNDLKSLVEKLRSSADPARSQDIAWDCHESDQPHLAILDAAAQLNCDLIVMASHGRRGFGALLLGSETPKVLTHSTVPVLVWRST